MEIRHPPIAAPVLAPVAGTPGADRGRFTRQETEDALATYGRRAVDRTPGQASEQDGVRVLRGEYLSGAAHGQEHNADPRRHGRGAGYGMARDALERGGSSAQRAIQTYRLQQFIEGPASLTGARYVDIFV